MTDFDPTKEGMQDYRNRNVSRSVYKRDQVRWLKSMAKREGYTGSLSRYVPRGFNKSYYLKGDKPNEYLWKPSGYAESRFDLPWNRVNTKNRLRAYWEEPQRVGRWYEFLQLQEDDYVPPSWLDKDQVTSMYKSLKAYNGNEDWMRWKPVPAGSQSLYEAQLSSSPPGTYEEIQGSRGDLWDVRLPKIVTALRSSADKLNKLAEENKNNQNLTYDNYMNFVNTAKEYNISMEHIKDGDPELFETLGGLIDVGALPALTSEAFAQAPTPESLGGFSWDEMYPFQRTIMTLATTADVKGRPMWTKQTAALTSAGFQGFMSAALASGTAGLITSKVVAAAALPVMGPWAAVIPAVGFAIGVGVGINQYIRAMNGDMTPGVVDKIFNWMNVLDEGIERSIGVAAMTGETDNGRAPKLMTMNREEAGSGTPEWLEGEKVKIKSIQDFTDAWTAAQNTYASGVVNPGDWMIDAVSVIAHALSPDWSAGETTKEGQVWDFVKGNKSPVNLDEVKTQALVHSYNDIKSLGPNATAEDKQLVVAAYMDKFGISGSMNKMFGQMLISPTNFVPIMLDDAISTYASKKLDALDPADIRGLEHYTNLKMAAQTAIGNPLADVLPFPLQGVYDKLLGKIPFADDLARKDFLFKAQSSKSAFEVYAMADAMDKSAYSIGNVLKSKLRVELTGADGNKIYGEIIDRGNIDYYRDDIYKVRDDAGNVYDVNKDLDVIKAVDDTGKQLSIGTLKAGIDQADLDTWVKAFREARVNEAVAEVNAIAKAGQGSPARRWLSSLWDLTPDSKVKQAVRNLNESIIQVVSFSAGNPETFVNLLKYYAGEAVDVKAVGEAAKEYGLGGTTALAVTAFKNFVKSPELNVMISSFFSDAATIRRKRLADIVSALEIEKVADIVGGDGAKYKPAAIFDMLVKKNVTVEGIKSVADVEDLVKIFSGDNPLPINDGQFILQVTAKMAESTESDYMKIYGVKALPGTVRLSNLLKQALSVQVITLNVSTWLTNLFTNEVTTALFIGSNTFMKESTIGEFYGRLGIPQESIEGLLGKKFGLQEQLNQANAEMFKTLNPPKSWITKSSRWLSRAMDKTPVLNKVSKVYSNIEDFSRGRAAAGAIMYLMDNLPLSEIPADRYAELRKHFSPEEIEGIRRIANTAYNDNELNKSFIDGVEYHKIVDDAIDQAIVGLAYGDETKAGMLNELLYKFGLSDLLRENLPKCNTPQDVENLRSLIRDHIKAAVDTARVGTTSDAGTEHTSVIDVYKTMNSVMLQEHQVQYAANKLWQDYWDATAGLDDARHAGIKSQLYVTTRRAIKDMYTDYYDRAIADTASVIRSAGVGEYADRLTVLMAERMEISAEYFRAKDELMDDYYNRKTGGSNTVSGKKALNAAINKLTKEMRTKTLEIEKAQGDLWVEQLAAQGAEAQNGLTGEALSKAARELWDAHMKRKRELTKMTDAHYRETKDMQVDVRQAANEKFYTEKYQPAVAAINSALTEDYYKIFHKTPTGGGEAAAATPAVGAAAPVDAVKTHVEANAHRVKKRVQAAESLKRVMTKADGVIAKDQVEKALMFSNATQEQVLTLSAEMEAVARTWGNITNRNYEDWYSLHFGSIEKYDVDFILGKGGERGAADISWDDSGAIIRFTRASNFTSAAHEVKHIYLRMLTDLYNNNLSTDLDVIAREFGGVDGNELVRLTKAYDNKTITEAETKLFDQINERFVEGATVWQKDIASVQVKYKGIFGRFVNFLINLFDSVGKRFDLKLSDGMQKVYENLYAKYSEVDRSDFASRMIGKGKSGVTKKVSIYGKDYEVTPTIVERGWLTRAHNDDGSVVDNYPAEYAPRKYNKTFVRTKALDFNPDYLLLESSTGDYGPSFITNDGYVLMGDHRIGVLDVTQQNGGVDYDSYVGRLKNVVRKYGLSAKDLEGFDNPVLVYKVADDDVAGFVQDAGKSTAERAFKTPEVYDPYEQVEPYTLDGIKLNSLGTLSVEAKRPLRQALVDLKNSIYENPEEPPRWMLASSLYKGETADYANTRKAIDSLIAEFDSEKMSKSKLRDAVIDAAWKRAIGTDIAFKNYVDYDGKPEYFDARYIKLNQDLDEVLNMNSIIDGQLRLSDIADDLKRLDSEATDAGYTSKHAADTWRKANNYSQPVDDNSVISHVARKTLLQGIDETNTSDDWAYSAALRKVEASTQRVMTADQARALLKTGVKQGEYDYLDIDGFLEGKTKVTKEQLADYIKSNRLILEEIIDHSDDENNWVQYNIEGGRNYRTLRLIYPGDTLWEANMHWNTDNVLAWMRFDERTYLNPDGTTGKALQILEVQSDWIQKGQNKGWQTEFNKDLMSNDQWIFNNRGYSAEAQRFHTVEAFRAKPITVNTIDDSDMRIDAAYIEGYARGYAAVYRKNEAEIAIISFIVDSDTERQFDVATGVELLANKKIIGKILDYGDRPQYLRGNTIQYWFSGWEGRGRYGNLDDAELISYLTHYVEQETVNHRDWSFNALIRDRDNYLPVKPAITDFNTLTLKRMIRYAAENDYDLLLYPTHTLQAEIEQHIVFDNVRKFKYEERTNRVIALDKDGSTIYHGTHTPEELPGAIGGEAVSGLLAAPEINGVREWDVPDPENYVWSGLSYVAAEKIWIKDANKYLKQFGVQVDETGTKNIVKIDYSLGSRGANALDMDAWRANKDYFDSIRLNREDFAKEVTSGPVYAVSETAELLYKVDLSDIPPSYMIRQANSMWDYNHHLQFFRVRDIDEYGLLKFKPSYVTRESHSIVIPPELKDVALRGQQPLFQPIEETNTDGTKRQPSLFDLPDAPKPTELPPMTDVPVDGYARPRDDARAIQELMNMQIEPLVDSILGRFKGMMGQPSVKLKMADMSPEAQAALKSQLSRWGEDIKLKRATAVNYGKTMVDHTLLNYTEKRGIDKLLEFVYPYHFWYTQSITEWSKALLSRPSIGAAWAKYKQMLRTNGIKGLPTRLGGRSPVYIPWLEDYLGDTLWINPGAKIMPLESIFQPITTLADRSGRIADAAVSYINRKFQSGEITEQQARTAIADRSSQVWYDAIAYAQTSEEAFDPMSAASWSMQPGPWYTYPYYFGTDQKDKISPFPITRLGNAWAAQDDGVLGSITSTIGKMLAFPGNKLREATGLSVNGFNSDYYIDFMLSNLATSGQYDTDTIIRAMIERSGPVYEEGKKMANEYLSYRLPGSALIQAIASRDINNIAAAMLLTMFPAGIYPKGEMEQRGLAQEFSKAWDDFAMGDKTAITKFYDENPEYEARLALFDDPKERLHSHLINILWDRWYKISDPDKKLIQQQFGDSFNVYFLNPDNRDYSKFDNDTLAYWNRQLGNKIPVSEETAGAAERTLEPLELYKPEVSAAGQNFIDLRKQTFPDYWWQQNLYYELPKEKQDDLLRAYPELKEYWDWKDEMSASDPNLAAYLEDQKERYTGSDATQFGFEPMPTDATADWDSELITGVALYFMTGQPLSAGVKAELNRIWVGIGKPGGSFDMWLEAYIGYGME